MITSNADLPGCWSRLGMEGGRQELNLNTRGCMDMGTIEHEFLHALGVHHEQTRPDRDQFVDIFWNNIIPKEKFNFYKESSSNVVISGPYDYGSVMHYSARAFGINNRQTIRGKVIKHVCFNFHNSLILLKTMLQSNRL